MYLLKFHHKFCTFWTKVNFYSNKISNVFLITFHLWSFYVNKRNLKIYALFMIWTDSKSMLTVNYVAWICHHCKREQRDLIWGNRLKVVAVKIFTWLSDVWLNNTNMMVWSAKILRDVVLISVVMIVWKSSVEIIVA